jgi:hypothetical protein
MVLLTVKIKLDIDHNCYFDRAKNDSTDFEYAVVSFSGRGAGGERYGARQIEMTQ